ncbi:hypothetical protein ABHI18_010816, partial [Aspergillus niger]
MVEVGVTLVGIDDHESSIYWWYGIRLRAAVYICTLKQRCGLLYNYDW